MIIKLNELTLDSIITLNNMQRRSLTSIEYDRYDKDVIDCSDKGWSEVYKSLQKCSDKLQEITADLDYLFDIIYGDNNIFIIENNIHDIYAFVNGSYNKQTIPHYSKFIKKYNGNILGEISSSDYDSSADFVVFDMDGEIIDCIDVTYNYNSLLPYIDWDEFFECEDVRSPSVVLEWNRSKDAFEKYVK